MTSHQQIARTLNDVFEHLSPTAVAELVGEIGQGEFMREAICRKAKSCILQLVTERSDLQRQITNLQAQLEGKQTDVNTGVVNRQDPFGSDSKHIEPNLYNQDVIPDPEWDWGPLVHR